MIWLAVFSLFLGAAVYELRRGFGESLCLMLVGLGTAMAVACALRLVEISRVASVGRRVMAGLGAMRLRKFLKENPAV